MFPFTKNTDSSKIFAFILGFSSMVSQIVLLREFVVSFYGNETSYALLFSSWLFWIAAGSVIASFFLEKIKNPLKLITVFQLTIFFIFPLTIIAVRVAKLAMNIPVGEIIDIIPICGSSFIILAPLNLFFGALFSLIFHLAGITKSQKVEIQDIRSVYFWEAVGSVVGGVMFSFVLIHLLNAMETAFAVGIINLASIYFFTGRNKRFSQFVLIIIIFSFLSFPSGLISKLNHYSRIIQWKGFQIVSIVDSIYGNIVLTKMKDEYSLYENGLLSFTTTDTLASEEAIHYPLLMHPDPKRILLLGNGISGAIAELLKYENAFIDYVELDAEVINISKENLPPSFINPIENSRVNIIYTDARHYVKTALERYDVVIVNLPDPHTALINRYYTLDFFAEANEILKEKGILSLSVSSSANYLNPENRSFLRSINSTLEKKFEDIKSIPGDTNIFVASKAPGSLSLDTDILIARLKDRGIQTKYVNENYIPYKLSSDRVSHINDVFRDEGMINTDMHPIAYLYDIILWSTHFNIGYKKFIEKFFGISIYYFFLIPIVLFIVGRIFCKNTLKIPLIVSILTTGFSEIIFQIIVIIAFQTLYGYAYYKIGLITASFMLGILLGSYQSKRILQKGVGIFNFYKKVQFSIMLYPLVLLFVLILFKNAMTSLFLRNFLASLFTFLPLLAGYMGGIQYPLATFLVSSSEGRNRGISKAAGFLYAADVFGAALGSILSATILIPLFGIHHLSILVAVLNFAVFLWLLSIRR